jgi:sugar/nucleoside kinase (ribokinase family)
MSILVVGSVALDRIETPFGIAERTLGGAATYFSAAASMFQPVQLVGVIGDDFPEEQLRFLADRGVDLAGLERARGESFFWAGRYDFDMNSRTTLETRLGVFADFHPRLPETFRDSRWVFLANIDPELQLDVLEQVRSPAFIACDTMNYWIESKRDALLALLGRVDCVLLNDSEARELSGDHNLLRAARWIRARGPRIVVVKKGEHGALLFTDSHTFFAPGYPLEEVFDPTGAGDAFAGGFMGWLAYTGNTEEDELCRAMIYGSATGSLVCERMGVERLVDLGIEEIHERVREFRRLTAFESPAVPVAPVHG